VSYQLIDMTKDPRSGQFAYFRQMLFPFAGVTAEVDITDFAARRQGRPFFLSFLYAVVRAANAVPQLRRRIRADGSVVEYDWCPPSYTAMKPDGVYVYCTVEGDLPYTEFVALGQRRQEEGYPHRGRRRFELLLCVQSAVAALFPAGASRRQRRRLQPPHQLGQGCHQ
jgi:chloramphenicol O-acetyltransferase type A